MTNAVKYSPPGGSIRVDITRTEGLKPEATLTVTDEGPGIPPDEHPKIFELFYRGKKQPARDADMSAEPKNLSASLKTRMQNEAVGRVDNFNLLRLRYGIERLLFRLSKSAYADRLLLMGAMLFIIWDAKTHRPTHDLDSFGFGPY